MRSMLRNIVIGSIASLAVGLTAIALSAPASASMRIGGGGGFHGGGFHQFGGGGFHGGFAGRHDRFRDRGFAFGLGLGALGAYDYGYPYDTGDYAYNDYGYGAPGCMAFRPTYDRYGHYLGRRAVDVCR